MKKRHCLLLLVILFEYVSIYSQGQPSLPSFPSPNAYNLGTYGNIPVNLFTGTPNITIPLYNLAYGTVEIPISLSYHPANLKANQHPGWVGLGWDLMPGGVITRNTNGTVDENQLINGTKRGFFYNYSKLNVDDWSFYPKLKEYSQAMETNLPIDTQADEFNFNFLGYSGKFFYNHLGEWDVITDNNIKVLSYELINVDQLRDSVKLKIPYDAKKNSYVYLNKFTLVDDHGIQYEFGGKYATEYSVPYRDQNNHAPIPTSWYLSKIILLNGDAITFEYVNGDMICSLSHSYYYYVGNIWGCGGSWGKPNKRPTNGFLILPVYLKSIKTSLHTVNFHISESRELSYDIRDMDYDPNYEEGEKEDVFYVYFKNLNQLKWQKLDSITISAANFTKSYEFSYINQSNERLKLNYISEKKTRLFYEFEYNKMLLPPYCSDQVDHWGYYNGYSGAVIYSPLTTAFVNYYKTRMPDTTGNFLRAEVLTTIYYPTGGSTDFEWEPHTYSRVVNANRITLSDENGKCGGLRIRKISSYAGVTPIIKEYYYVKNYSPTNPSVDLLTSSGILSGRSEYYWSGYKGGSKLTFDAFSSGSLFPPAQNGQGSHIGYSEVIERTSGNGYIKQTYTNFDKDIWGLDHMDEQALSWIDEQRSELSPFTSKSLERGKLTSESTYDESGNLLRIIKNKYKRSDDM